MQLLFNRFTKLLDQIWESKWKDILFALGFSFGALVILGLYYLGFGYKENFVRTYGYPVIRAIFAILCGLVFLAALKNRKMSKYSWICLSAVMLFYAISFATGFVRFGFHTNLMDYFLHFIVNALPLFLIGISGALMHSERSFLSVTEYISVFVLPGGLNYLNSLLSDTNPFLLRRYLGIIGYVQVAGTLMPFLLVHIIQFANQEPIKIPFTKKNIRHPQFIRGIFIAVYWLAIIGSGSRSIYVCIAGFCVLLLISQVIHREHIGRTAVLSAVLAVVLLFNMFVYTPKGMSYGVGRMKEVIDGFKQGKLITTTSETPGISDKLDEVVESDGHEVNNKVNTPGSSGSTSNQPSEVNTPGSSGSTSNQPSEVNTPGSSGSTSNQPSEEIKIGNRPTIFKLAWKEFLKSPLTGMGTGAFKDKYKINPHNAIMELLCETGLLGFIPMMLLIIIAIFRLIKAGWDDRQVRYILLFTLAFAIKENMDGNIWKHEPLFWALGYGLAFQIPRKPAKAEALEIPSEDIGSVPSDGNA